MRRRLLLASPLTALPLPALAQAGWPLARPVRIILPSPPGTPQDFYVRSLCDHYMRAFGGTFLVENRAGASGTIGLAAVANAPPDGYTLAFNSNTAQTISPLVLKDAGFDPLKSFTPVILFYKYGMFLLITASIPARNTREFLTWARAKRPSVNMASVGLGSGGMLMGERVKLRGGFTAEAIHYRGSAPALLAVAQGECDYITDNVGASASLRAEGRLRGLALTGKRRSPFLPDIPTLAEDGLPGFEEEIWFGLNAPAGAPPTIVQKLNAEGNRWLETEDIRGRMAGFMHEAMGGTPEAFVEFAAWDQRIWADVVRETGVKAE